MGVRALGLNAGLYDARTWDGSNDPTSGLSGAATCFNGPQSERNIHAHERAIHLYNVTASVYIRLVHMHAHEPCIFQRSVTARTS